jgi:glucans biosynthesis protein C
MNSKRLYFIDNLRWLMVMFVVMVHTTVTYSHIGGWYYYENQVENLDIVSKLFSAIFNSFNQAYFMGFLFLLAGYFVPSSFDKKGAGKFIKDRLIRLGVPLLIYIFIIDPFINFVLKGLYLKAYIISFTQFYSDYITKYNFLSGTGPLWFAETLLIFSLIYVLLRVTRIKLLKETKKDYLPSHLTIVLLILLISCIAFLIRLVYPINTGFLNLQFCYFAQYIILFIIGIKCYRTNLLMRLPYNFGKLWFRIVLIGGSIFWILMMIFGGALNGGDGVYYGGMYWQTVAYALWESSFCAGICLGLIVIFREKFNYRSKLNGFLSDNYFGVYVFHAPILVFISISLRHFYLYPLLKILIVGPITIFISFTFSYFIRKVPGFKNIFS